MKIKHYIFIFLIFPRLTIAQVDFNKTPDDDLGIVEDQFQETFFEALKQRGVENYDKAVEALLKCIEIDKSHAILYFELGKNYIKLKNFGAAEEALKEAVSKSPENEWYLDELYGYYVSQSDTDKALKVVKQLVKFHPDYKEDLASLYVKMKKYDDALDILNDLDSSFGISASRDLLRNRIYKATGRAKDQIANLKTRVEDNPKNEANYLALIYRYSEQNKKEKAFKVAQELLKINPNSQIVHLALYKFYLDKNDTANAIKSMKIVINSNEIKPEAKLTVLSDFVNFVKQNPDYEKDLIDATTLLAGKTDAKTLVDLATYYFNKNDKENALRYFEEALKLDSENFKILKKTLLLYIDLDKYKDAKSKSDEALLKFPAQPLLYLINGVANNKLHHAKEAITVLESGLDWIVEDAQMTYDFYIQLAKAHQQLNNTEKVKTFMEKANALKSK